LRRINEKTRVALLIAITILVYANTLANGFVYDDGYYVLHNQAVTAFSFRQLFHPMGNNVFRPAMSASLALNWAAGGAQAFGYHLVNILLHVAVTLLLYFLLRKLLEQVPHVNSVAFATAALFAVHPIHTEAVAWITGRSELLAAGFLLGAWLLHLHDQAVAALLCFVLALLSKESAIIFFPLAIAGDYVRGRLKPVRRYAWIAGIAVAYLIGFWKIEGGRFGEQGFNPMDNPLASLSHGLRIANALRIAWKYLSLQIYPAKLSCNYSYNAILLYANWRHTLFAVLGAVCVLALWLWTFVTGRRAWFLAGAIYLMGFAVTGNVVMTTGTIMGERLAYLPSAGLCLLVALIGIRLENYNQRLAALVLAMMVLALGTRTVIRNRDWKDNFALFSAAVRVVPGSAKAHALLGQEYLRRGQLDSARSELRQAVGIFPEFPQALENYALVEARSGHEAEARELFEKALFLTPKVDPDYDNRAVNLAAWLIQQKEDHDALRILDQVIADSPGEARAWSNRAVACYRLSDLPSARTDAQEALRLDPTNPQARELLNSLSTVPAESRALPH
jgi:protein O-mannosyl-transferase